jgi:hypothetical protein
MIVSLDRLVPQPGDPNAVAFWEWMMAAGPIAAGSLTLATGWLLGAFVDWQWVDKPVTFVQALMILGSMCFPVAAFLAARRRWFEARARDAVAWPTVAGKVEGSRIEKMAAQYGTKYRLALAYRYQVGGQDYEGDRVEFGPRRVGSEELIERLADKYLAGADVTVHYDPDDPATAVLETSEEMARQNQWVVWFLLGMPVGLSILAAVRNAWSS